jgi:hypothetical protein
MAKCFAPTDIRRMNGKTSSPYSPYNPVFAISSVNAAVSSRIACAKRTTVTTVGAKHLSFVPANER